MRPGKVGLVPRYLIVTAILFVSIGGLVVLTVTEGELQRMLLSRQFNAGFGLARPKMQMGFILRDRLFRIERVRIIYQ